MLLNHACFFIPLRRGAQQAVLRQQICASGALLNNNPIRTTRQRRANEDRHSSLLSRFEDALLIHTNAFRRGATTLCSNPVRRAQRSVPGSLPASAISVPEVRHFNISKKKTGAFPKRACLLIYMCFSTTLPQPACKASPMRRQRPYTPPCRQQCSSPQEGRDFPCMPVSSPCRQVSEHKEL